MFINIITMYMLCYVGKINAFLLLLLLLSPSFLIYFVVVPVSAPFPLAYIAGSGLSHYGVMYISE